MADLRSHASVFTKYTPAVQHQHPDINRNAMYDCKTSKRDLGHKETTIASKKTRKELPLPMETDKSSNLLSIQRKILQDMLNTTETLNLQIISQSGKNLLRKENNVKSSYLYGAIEYSVVLLSGGEHGLICNLHTVPKF